MILLTLLSVIVSASNSLAVSGQVCDSSAKAVNNAFIASQEEFKKTLQRFADTPLIAKKADEVLSKLITAKSPAIISWMKRHDSEKKSESEIVHEWRNYYARDFVIGKYPQADPATNRMIEKLMNDVYAASLPKKQRDHLSGVFEQTKDFAITRAQEFKLSEKDKKALITRIKTIQLYWMDNFKDSKFAKTPLEAVSWGVAYDPATNEVNIGIEALRYANDETLFAVFAHEIGHSFDPCRWGAFFQEDNPFEQTVSCLRDPKSAGAKTRDDSQLASLTKSGRVSEEIYAALKKNPTCNKMQYPPIGIQADQSLEAFADWFSAEVLSVSPRLNSKIRTDLCEDGELNPGSSYISNRTRLNRIYLANPIIRAKLDLEKDSDLRYCPAPEKS